MESSELFLIAWAVIATILAVYYSFHANIRGKLLVVLTLGMQHIAEGKAEIYVENGEIKIKRKEKDNA